MNTYPHFVLNTYEEENTFIVVIRYERKVYSNIESMYAGELIFDSKEEVTACINAMQETKCVFNKGTEN